MVKKNTMSDKNDVATMTDEEIMKSLVIMHQAHPMGPIALSVADIRAARRRADRIAAREAGVKYVPDVTTRDKPAKFLSAAEAARTVGVSASWLLKRAREHLIPHIRVENRVLFHPEEIAQFVRPKSKSEATRGLRRRPSRATG